MGLFFDSPEKSPKLLYFIKAEGKFTHHQLFPKTVKVLTLTMIPQLACVSKGPSMIKTDASLQIRRYSFPSVSVCGRIIRVFVHF